ncbi:MAG: hypothetical protein AAF577_02735 [Pseudomonadota bacterium]
MQPRIAALATIAGLLLAGVAGLAAPTAEAGAHEPIEIASTSAFAFDGIDQSRVEHSLAPAVTAAAFGAAAATALTGDAAAVVTEVGFRGRGFRGRGFRGRGFKGRGFRGRSFGRGFRNRGFRHGFGHRGFGKKSFGHRRFGHGRVIVTKPFGGTKFIFK